MATPTRRPLKLRLKPKNPDGEPVGSAADPLARQRRYVSTASKQAGGLGLVFADAFIRGMREIGYKNPAWAIAEIIDNSFQAGATAVDIRFKDADLKSERSKPSQIAVLDNGIGMISDMISFAVRWGGTDRENDRKGFGRYGYGLPSAAVSLARRYSVYSKIEDGEWHVVTVDLDALSAVAGDAIEVEKLLKAKAGAPPKWLSDSGGARPVNNLESGTIVVLEDLDRLHSMAGWVAAKTLQMKLLQQLGLIYRHNLNDKRIFVAGERAQIVDPLFLLPGARYADETEVVAKAVATSAFEIEDSNRKGIVRVRAAVLPPNFQNSDPSAHGKGAKLGRRHDIMKASNGILVCRAGRQIDVVTPEWTKFQNYDLNIKIEIDFDPTLDEFFGLTTSKQQIVIDDRMWEKLKQSGANAGGLQALIKEMRADLGKMRADLAARSSSKSEGKTRPSAAAMQAAQKFKTRTSTISPQKAVAAEKALGEYARSLAQTQDIPLGEASEAAKAETSDRPFDIEFAAREEAPLYQAKRLGLQKRLIINTAHPFFTKVYQRAGDAQAGLEVLLFILADAELDAEGDRETFYRTERSFWSEGLRHALDELESDQALTDRTSAEAEAT